MIVGSWTGASFKTQRKNQHKHLRRNSRAPTFEEDNGSTQGSTQSLAWDNYDPQRRTQERTRPQDTHSSQPTEEEEERAGNRTGELLERTHSRREEIDPPEENDDDVFEKEELFSPARSNGNPTEEEEGDLFTPVRLWNLR